MLTPLDIHNKEFKRAIRGYDADEVDEFLDEIIKDYEHLYKDNLNLKDQIESIQENIARYRELEDTLHNTMILAQQTAEEVKKNAEKEAELIIRNAKQKAEEIVLKAKEDIIELKNEYKELQKTVQQFKAQFKAFLLAQLELVDDGKKSSYIKTNIDVTMEQAEGE
ncbi:MAG: DivIVA domain-containing protein [Clostridia bacterium]|nr:DivIVA domain-containing protein [Clostridia bacterium]